MADNLLPIWKKSVSFSGKSGPHEILLSGIGSSGLLEHELIGVFSSIKCPARLILAAHDKAKEFSKEMNTVISGFQSPVEKEMLEVLLQGGCGIVICPARGLIGMCVPAAWRQKISAGQLLILSPFPAYIKRPTPETVEARNHLVARLASKLLIVHAEPGGKVEMVVKEAELAGKQIRRL